MLGILRTGKDLIIGSDREAPPHDVWLHCMACWAVTWVALDELRLVADGWLLVCECCAADLDLTSVNTV